MAPLCSGAWSGPFVSSPQEVGPTAVAYHARVGPGPPPGRAPAMAPAMAPAIAQSPAKLGRYWSIATANFDSAILQQDVTG